MKRNRLGIVITCALLTCSLPLVAQIPATQGSGNTKEAKPTLEQVRKEADQGDATAQFNLVPQGRRRRP